AEVVELEEEVERLGRERRRVGVAAGPQLVGQLAADVADGAAEAEVVLPRAEAAVEAAGEPLAEVPRRELGEAEVAEAGRGEGRHTGAAEEPAPVGVAGDGARRAQPQREADAPRGVPLPADAVARLAPLRLGYRPAGDVGRVAQPPGRGEPFEEVLEPAQAPDLGGVRPRVAQVPVAHLVAGEEEV